MPGPVIFGIRNRFLIAKITFLILILLVYSTQRTICKSPFIQPKHIPQQGIVGLFADLINQLNIVIDVDAPQFLLSQLKTPQIIRHYGYPAESHRVITPDGYILTMHRIPHGKSGPGPADKKKPVVFFMHGIALSSSIWFVNKKERLLALKLADEGYDVWFGNNRGNHYSRGHVKLNVWDRKYFDFSFHEIAKYDLTSKIDYILNKTGQTKLKYIGYSMGTTSFFVMNSVNPSYNDKISLFIGLAPVAYLENCQGFPRLIQIILLLPQPVKFLFDWILNGELVWPFLHTFLNVIGPLVCSVPLWAETICRVIYIHVCGWQGWPINQNVDVEQLTLLMGNIPSPTSTKTGWHYLQWMINGKFQYYDYGKTSNQLLYGQPTSPLYYLNMTTAPVALLPSPNDGLADARDFARLVSELPNVVYNVPINMSSYNHFDMLIGKDANTLVNEPILKLFSQY